MEKRTSNNGYSLSERPHCLPPLFVVNHHRPPGRRNRRRPSPALRTSLFLSNTSLNSNGSYQGLSYLLSAQHRCSSSLLSFSKPLASPPVVGTPMCDDAYCVDSEGHLPQVRHPVSSSPPRQLGRPQRLYVLVTPLLWSCADVGYGHGVSSVEP